MRLLLNNNNNNNNGGEKRNPGLLVIVVTGMDKGREDEADRARNEKDGATKKKKMTMRMLKRVIID